MCLCYENLYLKCTLVIFMLPRQNPCCHVYVEIQLKYTLFWQWAITNMYSLYENLFITDQYDHLVKLSVSWLIAKYFQEYSVEYAGRTNSPFGHATTFLLPQYTLHSTKSGHKNKKLFDISSPFVISHQSQISKAFKCQYRVITGSSGYYNAWRIRHQCGEKHKGQNKEYEVL